MRNSIGVLYEHRKIVQDLLLIDVRQSLGLFYRVVTQLSVGASERKQCNRWPHEIHPCKHCVLQNPFKWVGIDDDQQVLAILTIDVLWDWAYVDELWVHPEARGTGLGKRLMNLAEEFAEQRGQSGIWLWTQSWQAEGFYRQLGYEEFTRLEDFPKGYTRIGFRKRLSREML